MLPFRLRNSILLLTAVLAVVFAIGCAQEERAKLETKHVDEKVTEEELQRFLRVIDGLQEKKLPDFKPVYAPPPDWASGRSRPVGELVKEELASIEERWDFENLKGQLRRDKRLHRVLRREQMTTEQFLGLSLTLAVALGRNTIREDQDLERLAKLGRQRIEQLQNEVELFSSLTPQQQHSVLQRAVWITRTDRAKRLLKVPPENVTLVRANRERLDKIFPTVYTSNPLDPVADLLAEQGIPFEELPSAGFDSQIEWSRADAIIGRDVAPVSPSNERKSANREALQRE